MTEIAFITLFLGLTLGTRPVELNVSGDVHRIELRLDGTRVASMKRPPWSADVDFGTHLVPRTLTAHAFDKDGAEIAKAEQTINIPRPSAETRLVVKRDARGAPRAVRILWQSVEAAKPKRVELMLDGQPLSVGSNLEAALPPLDDLPHLLRARVISPTGKTTEAELVLSSGLQSESGASISAIPIRLLDATREISLDDAKKWLTIGGAPARIVAIEETGGDIIVIRHPNAAAEMAQRIDPHSRIYTGTARNTGESERLTQENTLSMLWPAAVRTAAGTPTDAFTRSPLIPFSSIEHFKRDLMMATFAASDAAARFTDAVAAAGLEAMSRRRPRAVVLILGRERNDASQFDAAQAHEYLDSIGVPLFVWSLTGPADDAWHEAADISTPIGFADAYRAVIREIRAQRIVWVEGDHLPGAATVTSAGKNAIETLAGANVTNAR